MIPTDVLLAGVFCRSRWRQTMPNDRPGLPNPRRLRGGGAEQNLTHRRVRGKPPTARFGWRAFCGCPL